MLHLANLISRELINTGKEDIISTLSKVMKKATEVTLSNFLDGRLADTQILAKLHFIYPQIILAFTSNNVEYCLSLSRNTCKSSKSKLLAYSIKLSNGTHPAKSATRKWRL